MDQIIQQEPREQIYSPVPERKHFLSKKLIVSLVVLILMGTGAYAGIWYWQKQDSVVICGTIAGLGCPVGYECKYAGNYPDAGGMCVRSDRVFCTQDAKQCPDGSYVGRTGPNCEFADCPKTTGTGILMGKVSIGPICPVEREDVSCTPSPETYVAHGLIVLSGQKEITRFYADANGNYRLNLSPGTYTITTAKTGFGYMSKDLPKTVLIKKSETVTLNIDIDTGIR